MLFELSIGILLVFLGHCSNFQKNYEIPTNVTDKIMKFTTKSVHIVASVAHLKYLYIYKISICEIYMFKVCTYFVQCVIKGARPGLQS